MTPSPIGRLPSLATVPSLQAPAGLQLLGSTDAEVCIDGVCVVPGVDTRAAVPGVETPAAVPGAETRAEATDPSDLS